MAHFTFYALNPLENSENHQQKQAIDVRALFLMVLHIAYQNISVEVCNWAREKFV